MAASRAVRFAIFLAPHLIASYFLLVAYMLLRPFGSFGGGGAFFDWFIQPLFFFLSFPILWSVVHSGGRGELVVLFIYPALLANSILWALLFARFWPRKQESAGTAFPP
jgi:hypothetical protein